MRKFAERFKQLFSGSSFSHGIWHADRAPETVREPASDSDYEAHLSGKVGLGVVPINDDGTCRFAAIDIDVDTINHAELFKRVNERRLPLSVCRSKSGGAHLYVFIENGGVSASFIREKLKVWAALIGYPGAEIFPKQSRINKKNLGNWINLPYFSGDKTTRYAVGPSGSLTLEEFLDTIKFYDNEKPGEIDESVNAATEDMPPCLQVLSQSGLPEGMRNSGLFNFGVFFRKSDPKGWQDKLQQFNLVTVKPALTFREFSTIAKSLSKNRYQYTCEQSPIREHCDRAKCLLLKYGVGHKPWEELDQYDEASPVNLRKILTTPPRYILEVNGHDLELSFEDLTRFQRFRDRVLQEMDLMIRPMKQGQWDLKLKELLKTKQDVEAPPDASPEGQLLEALYDFIALRDRARSREDLLRGSPIEGDQDVIFRIQDFMRYLQSRRLDKMQAADIYVILKRLGCSHRHVSIKGRKLFAWALPKSLINEQTEEFDKPERMMENLEEEI